MSRRSISMCSARISGALLALNVLVAGAIDAPAPAVPAASAAEAPPSVVDVAPSDETAFHERLQYVTHKRTLTGLGVSEEVLKSLAGGSVEMAITTLGSQSAAGDRNATIALVRIQHWCSRVGSTKPADAQTQLSRLSPMLSAQRLARVAGVFDADRAYQARARQGCGKAPFDYRGIEARLRSAAEAGDPASATELAQFVRDPAQREALLQQAADRNYAPAMYGLATNRVVAVQRGQTTENVGSIRLLLKQAGRTLPKAKVDLANCMALACDGHPADASGAAAFGIDAARDGEPTAFLSMMRMPWGRRLSRPQILAWQYFGDRLNESGCTGDAYVQNTVFYTQTLTMLEQGQTPTVLEQARTQAETLWRDNGERAKHEQGCG
ncbi:MAG TPA: hypothetical protein VIT67_08325 [Povalibacter sp.]